MADGETTTDYYKNRNAFIQPFTKVEFLKDTIKATTLHEINSCGKTVGKIKLSNDTIYLLTEHISREECTSVQFNKFTYLIRNSANKRYAITF